jgi:hypothetical protein
MRNAYILIGNYGGRRPLGRSRCTGEGNIKMGKNEIGSEDVYWIHLVEDWGPVADSCEHDKEPLSSIEDGRSWLFK